MQSKRRNKYTKGKVYVYGKHALMEALRNAPQSIREVFLAPHMYLSATDVGNTGLRASLAKLNIPSAQLTSGEGKELAGRDATHQGVIFTIDPSTLLVSFENFMKSLDMKKNPSIAILGEVQDPHNVGAIIRSAAAFGLSGVLIPEHNQAPITGVVVKSSAGMAFRIPLVTIGNVNNSLKILKKKGFWIYGLTMNGTTPPDTEAFNTPSVFVVGNEGTGIREKTLAMCDVTLSIPIHVRAESLNAATAAAIIFYEWSRKNPKAV